MDFLSSPLTLEADADADDATDIEVSSTTVAAAGSPTSCFSTLQSSNPSDAVVAIVVPGETIVDADINIDRKMKRE